jgi:hypothetical protein
VKIWPTVDERGTLRVVLLNKGQRTPADVELAIPGAPPTASLARLTAPALAATSGVTLAGQSYDGSSGQARGSRRLDEVRRQGEAFRVALPAGSGAILTVGSP